MNKLRQILSRIILTQKDREDLAKIIEAGSNSGGDNALVPITYAELKALKDNSQLVPGTQYRITDYECATVQENTTSAGHHFDIIVIADSEDTLNENARACMHEGDEYFTNSNLSAWELKYSLDNDTNMFAWASSYAIVFNSINTILFRNPSGDREGEYCWVDKYDSEVFTTIEFPSVGDEIYVYGEPENISEIIHGKGVIYYMKDEFNNECPYDFKNIQFYRKWNSDKELWCDDGTVEDGVAAYTFSSDGGYATTSFTDVSLYGIENSIYGNVIKAYWDDNYLQLNNICFFGNDCYSNTFGNDCYSNTFGESCYSNTFDANCARNTFGNTCANNTFGDKFYSNTFGNDCHYNTFGNSCSDNTFGNGSAIDFCQYIALGDGVQYCKIYGTTTPTGSNYLQNIKVAQGLRGTLGNRLDIAVEPGLAYETKVAKNSSGTLKIYCEADLVTF